MSGEKRLLSIKDAVTFTQLSKRSLERMMERGDIETVRFPGIRRVFLQISDLDRIIKEGRSAVPGIVPDDRHILALVGGSRRKR